MNLKFEELFSRLSAESHIKGKSFEKISKWWLTNDELWSSLVKQVWLWDEWPHRNTRDLGIDLVAEGLDGTLWAIQCKAYDPESNLKKSDIDSFLSASSQKQFSNRLLITTTKSIGENARNTISDQEKPVQVVDWIRLNDSSVDWSLAEKGLKTKQQTPRNLRPHQEKALSSVIDGFSKSNRGQLIMACGTGKTLTGLRINEAMGNELTILLVPSLTLLSQTLKDWLTDRKIGFKWLAVCSDDSVTSDPSDNARLVDYDIPATTDIKVIQKFLGISGKKVIFSTYQSSDILKSAILKSKIKVDFVIADEAHRLAGKIGREFASFLDPGLPVSKRLFMTATPRVYAGSIKKMSESLDIKILSMDDKDMFGEVFYRYSFSKAISEGNLSDYRVVVIGIDDISTKDLFNKRSLVKAGVVETDSESLALHVALSKAIRKWNLRRIITFHSRVIKARKFANDQVILNGWMPKKYAVSGKLNATTISSSMPTSKRRQILDVLKNLNEGETGLVSNARCLTEGIDVPTLDAVVFVDPKTSQIDIIQAIGRAIRLGGTNKTHGTVVVPVHVPKGKSSKDSFDASSYKKIGDVLNALRAHDEDFGEELDKLRTSLGQRGSVGNMPYKLIWDMPTTISRDFVSRIQAVSIEFATGNWEFMLGQLLAFVDENGHCRISARKGRKGSYNSLGGWIIKQRLDYHRGKLSKQKADSLAVLPGWSWDPNEDGFRNNFEALKTALVEFKSVRNVPRDYVTSDGLKLGQWLMSHRSSQGQKKMPKEKQELFMELPGWSWDFREDAWWAGYEAAKQWFESNKSNPEGEVSHPTADVLIKETGYSLNNWIKVTLKQYRTNSFTSIYTPDKKAKLEEITNWDIIVKGTLDQEHLGEKTSPASIRNMDQFVIGVEKYRKMHGDINFPITQNYKPFEFEGIPLGRWANGYRSAFKDGSIRNWEKKQLENILGWVWDELDSKWNEGFKSLTTFVERENHSQVPQFHKEGEYPLGTWIARQRRIKKGVASGSLTSEQIKKLEALPNWTWDASKTKNLVKRDQKWEMYFKALEKYFKKNGSSKVPSNYVDGEISLGRWVAYQKAAKAGKIHGSKISKREIQRLESFPDWKW